jgi:hypothetical protein
MTVGRNFNIWPKNDLSALISSAGVSGGISSWRKSSIGRRSTLSISRNFPENRQKDNERHSPNQ